MVLCPVLHKAITDGIFAVFIRIGTFVVGVYSVYEKGIDKYVISVFFLW